ncbi:hydrophobin-251 [Schizopora paradoxa]|uniref:Hydrophobin n=1 Tax=Schizopora paradoxa TaxID=27342 RepID=A0A0H2S1U0_9AGAM|nr:hydrophobin-251 [Schizopora paradoxa]
MMFNKLAFATILAVATTSLAQTGNACCNSVQSSSSQSITSLLGAIGVVLQGVNVPIGLDCSPITGVGVSGTSCTNDPVDCDQIIASALVGINCTPIDVSG